MVMSISLEARFVLAGEECQSKGRREDRVLEYLPEDLQTVGLGPEAGYRPGPTVMQV